MLSYALTLQITPTPVVNCSKQKFLRAPATAAFHVCPDNGQGTASREYQSIGDFIAHQPETKRSVRLSEVRALAWTQLQHNCRLDIRVVWKLQPPHYKEVMNPPKTVAKFGLHDRLGQGAEEASAWEQSGPLAFVAGLSGAAADTVCMCRS